MGSSLTFRRRFQSTSDITLVQSIWPMNNWFGRSKETPTSTDQDQVLECIHQGEAVSGYPLNLKLKQLNTYIWILATIERFYPMNIKQANNKLTKFANKLLSPIFNIMIYLLFPQNLSNIKLEVGLFGFYSEKSKIFYLFLWISTF